MVGTKGKENETSREVEAGERATTGHAEGCKLLLIALSMALTDGRWREFGIKKMRRVNRHKN